MTPLTSCDRDQRGDGAENQRRKNVPSPDDSLTVGLTDYLTDLQCLMTHLLMHSLIDLICN